MLWSDLIVSNTYQAPNLGGLVLFLVFIQFVAAVWYVAKSLLLSLASNHK